MGYTTVKIKDEDLDTLQKLKNESGISKCNLLSFSIQFVPWNSVCKICGERFIKHAVIYTHEFKEKR
jgi:hypothetical protein